MQAIRLTSITAIVTLCAGMSGCGSLLQGTTQYTMVASSNDEDRKHTHCTLTNEEGRWSTYPYENISIHRDGNDMTISCENGLQKGTTSVSSEFQARWLVMNLISDLCIFSCSIDAFNNSLYRYPDRIDVVMHKKDQ